MNPDTVQAIVRLVAVREATWRLSTGPGGSVKKLPAQRLRELLRQPYLYYGVGDSSGSSPDPTWY